MSSDTAIHVENLGKRYRIGGPQASYSTFRETLTDAFAAPFRRAGRLMSGGGSAADLDQIIWALKDVSFEVKRGEVVGIIGRNGAGKSTLLKILSRITEPTEGKADIFGRVGSLLEVGTGFHPELTGRENIYLNGAILGMRRTEIDRNLDEIIAFAEIEKFLDTPVKHYSSGMYVRLAFAVAAHLEPEILMVDEVLSVGDAAFQKKCLNRMSSVANEGRTVLFVSHNMAAITQLCGSTILLSEGGVIRQGAPQKVVKEYLSKGGPQRAIRDWSYPGDAPGDDRVRLTGCRIVQDGELRQVVDINREATIELRLTALQNLENLVAGVSLYALDGMCLFNTCDWRPNRIPRGTYNKRVRIPEQTLAEGAFSLLVQLVFFDPHRRSVVVKDALQFETMESAHPLAVRGPYKGNWPGLVRISLPWGDFEMTGRAYNLDDSE